MQDFFNSSILVFILVFKGGVYPSVRKKPSYPVDSEINISFLRFAVCHFIAKYGPFKVTVPPFMQLCPRSTSCGSFTMKRHRH